MTHTDNLVRSRYEQGAAEVRAAESDGKTFFGHFAVFERWTKIDSISEGRFLERLVPGTFKEAFRDKSALRVLFEHGKDPSIGNKPIASPDLLREEDEGAYQESTLLTKANYVQEIMPALDAGQLGASFRFSVPTDGDEWVTPRRATDHNPDMLPERTIRNVRLFEFGPVTWGAYADATAGIRSGTDDYIDRLLHDPLFLARMTERIGLSSVEQILSDVPEALRAFRDNHPPDAAQQGTSDSTRTATDIRLALTALRG